MTTEQKINITIRINGRKYPMVVFRSEEERYRKSAKFVEDRLRAYRDKYNNLTNEDCMGLVAFQAALGKLELEETQDISPFIEEVEQLNDELSDFLSDK